MSPSFTYKGEQVHRYYVSSSLQQGQPSARDLRAIRRLPATAVEDLVLNRVQSIARPNDTLDWPAAKKLIRRVEVHPECVQIVTAPSRPGDLEAEVRRVRSRLGPGERVTADEVTPGCMRLVQPIRLKLRGGRTWVLSV